MPPVLTRSLALLLPALVLGACRGGTLAERAPDAMPSGPPQYRPEGPRLPAFAGPDPAARGWTQVDGLLWVRSEDAEAHAAGLVRDGAALVPRATALAAGTPATAGHVLRTDHVLLRTNVAWDVAAEVAAQAEAHVLRLFEAYGEALDLRFPGEPLPVLLMATREEFQAHLRDRVAEPVGWGAFYDALTGVVNVCAQPAPRGALPLVADLRHEMTHQVLDLSRPPALRGRSFPGTWFWLWEGIAIDAERLGDQPGREVNRARAWRFRRRVRARQWTPLRDLLALDALAFEGRHYDQTGAWMVTLMDPGDAARRARLLEAVRLLLSGRPAPSVESIVGEDLEAHERTWLASWRRRGERGPPR